MDQKDYWAYYLTQFSRLSCTFIIYELFYNLVSDRKLIVMQKVLVH